MMIIKTPAARQQALRDVERHARRVEARGGSPSGLGALSDLLTEIYGATDRANLKLALPLTTGLNVGSGSAALDVGPAGNDFTLNNAPTWAVSGMTFNGTNQSAAASDFLGGGDLTVLVRQGSYPTPDFGTLVDQWAVSGGNKSWYVRTLTSGYGYDIWRSDDGVGATGHFEKQVLASSPASGQIVAVTWEDGEEIAAWIDGVSDETTLFDGTTQATRHDSTANITIGNSSNDPTGSTYAYAGEIHSVLIIAAALGSSAISAINDAMEALPNS